MKNTKRILAIAGVVVLAGLYFATLIFALLDSPRTFTYLKISIGLTILIPVLLWIYLSMYRYITQKKEASQNMRQKEESGK